MTRWRILLLAFQDSPRLLRWHGGGRSDDRAAHPEAEAIVRQKVESGLYGAADEVIHEALRLLDEHDRLRQLRAKLDVGLAQIERGEAIPFTPELVEQMKRDARRMASEGIKPSPDVCP